MFNYWIRYMDRGAMRLVNFAVNLCSRESWKLICVFFSQDVCSVTQVHWHDILFSTHYHPATWQPPIFALTIVSIFALGVRFVVVFLCKQVLSVPSMLYFCFLSLLSFWCISVNIALIYNKQLSWFYITITTTFVLLNPFNEELKHTQLFFIALQSAWNEASRATMCWKDCPSR